ncbi:MarR family transcriptional regulator [Paradesulfitobacterium aromaticivorans]
MTEQKLLFEGTTPSAEDVLHTLIRVTHYLERQFEINLSNLNTPFQLTGPRMRILLAVAKWDKIRASDLATRLGIQARTVTQFIDALERENLIVRLPDPNDRRAILLQLTDTAQPYVEKIQAAIKDAAEKVLKHLSFTQRNQVLETLSMLANYTNISNTNTTE